ncbi:hypothetical protein PO909_018317 [Leuciscus waleckii]
MVCQFLHNPSCICLYSKQALRTVVSDIPKSHPSCHLLLSHLALYYGLCIVFAVRHLVEKRKDKKPTDGEMKGRTKSKDEKEWREWERWSAHKMSKIKQRMSSKLKKAF